MSGRRSPDHESRRQRQQPVRVGLAYDAAFCFYYQDNLELLESAGAEIVRFSPLHDDELPVADLLYFGGGYPELYGETLAANMSMRSAVQTFARRGGAVYAECGGLMYLTDAIRDGEGSST
jgi:cobyrinic acid a,c-diamide synthase